MDNNPSCSGNTLLLTFNGIKSFSCPGLKGRYVGIKLINQT